MLTDITNTMILAINDMVRTFVIFLPRLLGALLILLIGWIVGRVVASLVTRALRAVRFDRIADRAEIDDMLRNAGVRLDPAAAVGELAKWFLFLIFFQAAATVLGIPQITAILNQIIAFIPNIVVALVIVLVGALAANLLMASGLIRIAEVANRITAGTAGRGVAHATSGHCLQHNLVCVLEGD